VLRCSVLDQVHHCDVAVLIAHIVDFSQASGQMLFA